MAEKNYFTIQEIAKKTQMPEYTLRYWESRFKLLRPLRLASGHRRYTARDAETINEIKNLVLMKGYTLPARRKSYTQGKRAGSHPGRPPSRRTIPSGFWKTSKKSCSR